jgi:alkanesulfonate monooxygenase SsuD/methylene tetrahydromethanopterin reductase-like flavin-dependent oxidoreductase (luciferase family)
MSRPSVGDDVMDGSGGSHGGRGTSRPVRVGMLPPQVSLAPASERGLLIGEIADHGLDHLVVGDHVTFWVGLGSDGLLAAAAALGARPDLAVYVGAYLLPLRHPVPVARQVADLAALAPGQLTLAVGVGGEDRHEVEVCGVDPTTRGRRMDECLVVLRGLLAGKPVSHDGDHVRVADALILPTPAEPVPLVVAGRSDAAVRRVGRLGDGWLGIWVSASRYGVVAEQVAEVAHGSGRDGVVWEHGLNVWCGLAATREAARGPLAEGMQAMYQLPFERFERWSPYGTPADVAEFLAPYVDAGCRSFNLIPCGDDPHRLVEDAAEVRRLLVP